MADESEDEDFEYSRPSEEEPTEGDTHERYFLQSDRQAASGDRRATGHLWLISYSDFMTIMMIFFLALYGYTVLAKATLLKSQEKSMTYSEFSKSVGTLKKSLGSQLDIEEDQGRVTVRLSDKVLFASGQAELAEESRKSISLIGESLAQVKGDIIVEGHTDNVPIQRGRFKTNWDLSAARAFSVIEALSSSKVPPDRMAAWGFGEHRPLVSNLDEAGRSQNRRIEIVLIKKKD